MLESYILDTSAIFAFTDQEEGWKEVGKLLDDALATKNVLSIGSISLMEVYYISLTEQNEDKAAELVALIKSWPVKWLYPDERVLLQAGKLKSVHRLSVADALIAAMAKLYHATLVHKDPELAALAGEVALLNLPFKKKKA